jgi:hypothetical protein
MRLTDAICSSIFPVLLTRESLKSVKDSSSVDEWYYSDVPASASYYSAWHERRVGYLAPRRVLTGSVSDIGPNGAAELDLLAGKDINATQLWRARTRWYYRESLITSVPSRALGGYASRV